MVDMMYICNMFDQQRHNDQLYFDIDHNEIYYKYIFEVKDDRVFELLKDQLSGCYPS